MKKLGIAVVAIVGLLAVGYALVLWMFNPETQRAALEQRLTTTFGQPAKVGKLTLSPLGGLSIVATDISVARDPAFGDGATLEVAKVNANVSLWDYVMSRQPVIENLKLEGAKITLVKREDGVWNWTSLGAGAPQAASAGRAVPVFAAIGFAPAGLDASRVRIEHIDLIGAEIVMVNREAEPDTEASYKNVALTADLKPNGQGYDVVGRLTGDSAAVGGEPLVADLPFKGTLTPPNGPGAWQAKGEIETGKFQTRNLALDVVRSGFALDEAQVLHLDPLHMELYGGTLDGGVSLALAKAGNHFDAKAKLENVGIEGVLAMRPDLAKSLGGRVTADFDGGGDLGDVNYTLQSLAGGGHTVVADATLSNVNVLAEVAKKGGLTGINFDEPGTHAERVEGDYRLEGGRVLVQGASVTNINGYANAHADSGWVDLKAPSSVSLSGTVTLLPPLFEKVRAASTTASLIMNAVSTQGGLTVPLSVNGPIEQPQVSVRWSEVLKPYFPMAGFLPFLGFGQ